MKAMKPRERGTERPKVRVRTMADPAVSKIYKQLVEIQNTQYRFAMPTNETILFAMRF